MDKHSKETCENITIKISGKEMPISEKMKVHHWQVEKESAATEEKLLEQPYVASASADHSNEKLETFKKIHYVPPKKKTSFLFGNSYEMLTGIFMSWKAAIAAVIIGLLFGFVMLKIAIYPGDFFAEQAVKKEKVVQHKKEENGSASTQQMAVIQPITVALVQGGVFSSAQAAESTANMVKSKGLPTMIAEIKGQHFLYIISAENLDTAKVLGEKIAAKNVEVYAKEFTIAEKNIQVETKAEAEYLQLTNSLFLSMLEVETASYFNRPIDQNKLTAIEEKINKIKDIDQIENKGIKSLQAEQLKSYQAFKQYLAAKTETEWIAAQQAQLDYLKQLISL